MVIDYKNFDDKIRDAFDDFEVRPPSRVWYGVVAGMSEPAKKGMAPVFLKVAAGIAVLLVSSFSFWFLTFQPTGNTPGEIFSQSPLAAPVAIASSRSDASQAFLSPDEGSAGIPILALNESQPAEPGFHFPVYDDIISLQALRASLDAELPDIIMPLSGVSSGIPLFDHVEEALALVDERKDLSFLSLGMHFAPQYSYRHIINPTETNKAGIPFGYLEDPLFSFNMGLSVQARVFPWLSLQSGFNYGTMGQFVSNIIAFSHPDNLPIFEMDRTSRFSHPQTIVTSQGNIRLSEPTLFFADSESYRVITNKQFDFEGGPEMLKVRDFGVSQYFTYLEVPLLARIRVVRIQDAEFMVKAGGSLNYILGNEVFLGRKTMQRPIGETYGLRKFNFSAHGGIAVNIPIGNHFHLTFEPTAQIYLMPMVRDQLMIGQALPFQYSIFTGISYGF
ncbi:MAG: outer membrane beta-barrel protein [Bacteroides sp.]|jgi:hypothetical protein|nr:outer membrane beta-barrel protein [Bacteroides sp.]